MSPDVLEAIESPSLVAQLEVAGATLRILGIRLPGNPYHDPHGKPWPDNADRFTLLSRCAVAIAMICT